MTIEFLLGMLAAVPVLFIICTIIATISVLRKWRKRRFKDRVLAVVDERKEKRQCERLLAETIERHEKEQCEVQHVKAKRSEELCARRKEKAKGEFRKTLRPSRSACLKCYSGGGSRTYSNRASDNATFLTFSVEHFHCICNCGYRWNESLPKKRRK